MAFSAAASLPLSQWSSGFHEGNSGLVLPTSEFVMVTLAATNLSPCSGWYKEFVFIFVRI